MKLKALRFSTGVESSLGLLFLAGLKLQFLCFTLEDEFRTVKVYGETRIPAGTYTLELRTYGKHHDRYSQRFDFHQGMIEICEVPGFTDVLIHIGNKDDDTAGCLLLGDSSHQNITEEGKTGSSGAAYRRVYPLIADALAADEKVELEIENYA